MAGSWNSGRVACFDYEMDENLHSWRDGWYEHKMARSCDRRWFVLLERTIVGS